MAVRRPRIKAIANIGVKRKIKEELTEHISNLEKEAVIKKIKEENVGTDDLKKKLNIDQNENIDIKHLEKNQKLIENESSQKDEETSLAVNNNRSPKKNPVLTDLKKTTDVMKPRQRIKATPVIESIRRNSISNTNYQISQSDNETIQTVDAHDSPFKDPPVKMKMSNINRVSDNRMGFGSLSSQPSVKHLQQPPPSPHPKDLNMQPSRDHIPARQRKFSQMDDINRLSLARKEFNSKYSDKKPEKSHLKMFEFIYYNPPTNKIKVETKKVENQSSRNSSRATTPAPIALPIEESPPEESPTPPVPQLKLGPNGELVLDEKSLVIETTAAQQARQQLASKDCIYLDEYSGNNGFYSRQKRTKDWSAEETIKFYRCLHTLGTDFSLMLTLFPNRSRRDLKLKFKKEERYNGHLINKAILQPKAFDIAELKNEFKREEEAQLERERQFKELEVQNAKHKRETLKTYKTKYKSKADFAIKNGDVAYQIETSTLPKKRIKPKNKKKNIRNRIDKELEQRLLSNNQKSISSDPVHKNENQAFIKNDVEEEYENKCFQRYMDRLCDDNNELTSSNVASVAVTNEMNPENPNESIVESVRVKSQNNNNDNSILEITDISNIFSIADIMPQLEGIGSLALVTSKDKNSPNKKKYEIYILCKPTDTLSRKPLDLPQETIDCILTAIGNYQNSTSDNEI